MKLEIFDHSKGRYGSRVQHRAVSVTRRNAKISFSRQATEELGLSTEYAATFAKDSDSKNDWYVTFRKADPSGLPIRAHHGSGNAAGYSTLGITCRSLSSAILDSLKAKSGATLLIAQKPEIINGEEWYQLITAKPLRLN